MGEQLEHQETTEPRTTAELRSVSAVVSWPAETGGTCPNCRRRYRRGTYVRRASSGDVVHRMCRNAPLVAAT